LPWALSAFSGGAVAVAGGMILAIVAIDMVHALGKKFLEKVMFCRIPKRIAVYPLAVPYLLNPVGITILIIASGEVVWVAGAALIPALLLLVGAFAYLFFPNIDPRQQQVVVLRERQVVPHRLGMSEIIAEGRR
jgi:small neutral amino acid transporter SnatA (MarC family)